MKHDKKVKLSFLLISVLVLNLYIVYNFHVKKEGFIKETIKGVLNIIPVKPIKKFLKKEVNKTNNEFKAILYLAVGIFKLIVLIGVMPFVMIFLVKIVVIGGLRTIMSSITSAVVFMFSAPKVNIDAMSASSFEEINNLKKDFEELKQKTNS